MDIPRASQCCGMTRRSLQPGETFYSMLIDDGVSPVRLDFCAEVWPGERDKPRDNRIGWWRAKVPLPMEKRLKLAPNEVLLQLFDQLADRHDQMEMRYILALLLVRRRLLRIEREEKGRLTVYCGKRDTVYELPIALPSAERIEETQAYLAELLYA